MSQNIILTILHPDVLNMWESISQPHKPISKLTGLGILFYVHKETWKNDQNTSECITQCLNQKILTTRVISKNSS